MMQNARLDESQAGIKIAGENVNNLRCADDTTVMAESEEELKRLLRVKKERGKSRLETQQQKNLNNRIWSHQFSSVTQSCLTLCDPMDCSTPGLPVHHQLPEFTQTDVHWVGDAIQPYFILCRPLFLQPSIFPNIRGFSNESVCWWPKYWSFSFSISLSNEYSGLISFRMDWLDLFAVHRTLKSLLQPHSSRASIHQHSAFFIVQLYTSIHDYWKNHSLDKMDLCLQSNVSAF